MVERPAQAEIDRWHLWFARECNNRGWELAYKPSRAAAEDEQMLHLAHASAHHWAHAGTALNAARADVLLAHVHALLGHAAEATAHARRCAEYFETSQECEDWDKAFASAVLAFAARLRGDAAEHAAKYREARTRGEAVTDAEDRDVFLDYLAKQIPTP